MAAPDSKSNIDRLHAMLREISVDSDVKEEVVNGDEYAENQDEKKSAGSTDFNSSVLDEKDEETSRVMKTLAYDFEDEDSWLYVSPRKNTPAKSPQPPERWVDDDVSTPELNRIRGALASKLDLITLENRKDKFDSLVSKHTVTAAAPRQERKANIPTNHSDAVTLDWEYDDDGINGAPRIRQSKKKPRKHQYNYNEGDYNDEAWEGDAGGYNEPGPFKLDFPEHDYDDLQPMTLEFEQPSSHHHSTHTAQRSTPKLRRTSSGGNASRRIDKYDDLATDEIVATPTGNVRPRPSKYQFERSDSGDSDSAKVQMAAYSDQSDVESVGSNYSDSQPVQPRNASKTTPSNEAGTVAKPRGRTQGLTSSASPRGSSSNIATGLAVKPRGMVRPRTAPSSAESTVRVRPSPNNGDVTGVVRPRGSAQSPGSATQATPRGETYAATPRSSLPQPRRSTGIASPKSLPVAQPRRSRSPDPTSKAIPRGSAVARSAYAGY